MSRLKNLLMFSALPITIWRDFFLNVAKHFSHFRWQFFKLGLTRKKWYILPYENRHWTRALTQYLGENFNLNKPIFFLLQNIRINPNLVIKFLNLSLFFLKTILSKGRSIWLRLLLTYYDWLYIKRKNK